MEENKKEEKQQMPSTSTSSSSGLLLDLDDLDNLDMDDIENTVKQYNQEKKEKLKKLKFNKKDFPQVDKNNVKTWIYPSNIAERTYQFKICEEALYKNTLVCLPTGLGKTLIASVVMFNFYRWFPEGKIIFMAHTVALVEQQINACYNIMGIPEEDTVCLTGKVNSKQRVKLWKEKRVFFCTPQIVQKDLDKRICPAKEIVLIVVDEAHKATKNYSFVTVTKLIGAKSDHFRVLALTATPGKDHSMIQQVITNLRISHMEVRDEDDKDVKPYIHEREIQLVISKRDQHVVSLEHQFFKLVTPYLTNLFNAGVLYNVDPIKMSKGLLQVQMKRVMMQKRTDIYKLLSDFKILISLYSAVYYLQAQDMSIFVESLKKMMNPPDVVKKGKKKKILDERARNQLTYQPLFKTILTTAETFVEKGYLHPKLKRLEEVILEHFTKLTHQDTKAVVFVGYRKTVDIIVKVLSKHTTIVKATPFIGQASKDKGQNKGFSQKEQKNVIQGFRTGKYNVLVATQVGEEGLDIGETDLIVCYDSVSSPTRLIQRIGRTGRKRKGKVVVLLSEGTEQAAYETSQRQKRELFESMKRVSSNAHGEVNFFENSMRMIPDDVIPKVVRENIQVKPLQNSFSPPKKRKQTKFNQKILTQSEEMYLRSHYSDILEDDDEFEIGKIVGNLSKSTMWRNSQALTTPVYQLRHSDRTELFINCLRAIQDNDEELLENLNIMERQSLEEEIVNNRPINDGSDMIGLDENAIGGFDNYMYPTTTTIIEEDIVVNERVNQQFHHDVISPPILVTEIEKVEIEPFEKCFSSNSSNMTLTREQLNEKSKEQYKTNGHMDITKILTPIIPFTNRDELKRIPPSKLPAYGFLIYDDELFTNKLLNNKEIIGKGQEEEEIKESKQQTQNEENSEITFPTLPVASTSTMSTIQKPTKKKRKTTVDFYEL
ncbi:hypothetical protein ABK040_013707 [Willaertia magna]